ncbi:MAG: hypothetical protein KC417_13005 [Myxococcales bacterium]|nr:hypothetical protein [Myxococcales bacterium]
MISRNSYALRYGWLLCLAAVGCEGHTDINDSGRDSDGGARDADPSKDATPVDGSTEDDAASPVGAAHGLTVAHRTSCYLTEGDVYCWGSDEFGQFGNGERDNDAHPTPSKMPYTNARSMRLSRWANYVVTNNRELWVSGLNNHEQLPFETRTAKQVTGIPAVSSAVGTYRVGCYVAAANGAVRCMGENSNGEVGDGTNGNAATWSDTGLASVTAIAGGSDFVCAVANGEVWCWGGNTKGQLGNGDGGDGKAANSPQKLSLPEAATDVAAGSQHACARTETGNVYCWGVNWGQQAGASSDGAACGAHACIRSPKKVNVGNVLEVAASDGATCARHDDGTVTCWGDSGIGAHANELSSVVEIASGHESNHFCARSQDSKVHVKCWGTQDGSGQLGRGSVETNATEQKKPIDIDLPLD